MANARPDGPHVVYYYYVEAQNNYGHNYFLYHDVVHDDPRKYINYYGNMESYFNLWCSITIVPTTEISKSTISTARWCISTIISRISPWITRCYSFWSCKYFPTRISATISRMSTAIIPFSITSTRWRSFTVSLWAH